MRLFKSMVPGVQAAVSLLAIGLVVGVLWKLATRRQPASPPIEVAGGVTHQIGKIWQGEVVSQKFRLQNISAQPLRLAHVNPGCGCTSSSGRGEVIEPGKILDITVSLNTSAKDGPVEEVVYVWVEGYPQSLELKLVGNVVAQFPSHIELGSFLSTKPQSAQGKILDRAKPLSVKEVVFDTRFFLIEHERKAGQVEFTLKTKPEMPVGHFSQTIDWITDDETQPVKTSVVSGEAYLEIESKPAVVSLGSFAANKPPEPVRIEILSRLGKAFSISSIRTDSKFLETMSLKSNDGRKRIEMRITGKMPLGPLSCVLHVFTDNPSVSDLAVPVYGFVKESF